MNRESEAKDFKQLGFEDKDLVMFTITDLKLENSKDQVHMKISLKRKIQTEILTTYLPTLLLLAISYATIYFKPVFFEASLTVNLTIMLVMTTIFTSKIAELPPTSDTKMIDIWLIFCLLVPFSFALIQTAIQWYRDEKTEAEKPEAWSENIQEVCLLPTSHFIWNLSFLMTDRHKHNWYCQYLGKCNRWQYSRSGSWQKN